MSGFSSSGHSFHSAAAGEAEDASSVCSSTVTIKEVAAAVAALAAGDFPAGPNRAAASPSESPAAKPHCVQLGEISSDKVRRGMTAK